MLERYYGHVPHVIVEPGVRTGVPVLIDNPKEVGADRIANTLAAPTLYGGPSSSSTSAPSTNFDVISAKGEFLGGALAPGLEISLDALVAARRPAAQGRARRAPHRDRKNTVEALQSGSLYGFAGQVDGLVTRIIAELGGDGQRGHRHRWSRAVRDPGGHDRHRAPSRPDPAGPAARLRQERLSCVSSGARVFAADVLGGWLRHPPRPPPSLAALARSLDPRTSGGSCPGAGPGRRLGQRCHIDVMGRVPAAQPSGARPYRPSRVRSTRQWSILVAWEPLRTRAPYAIVAMWLSAP